jgi:hypothetical protein
MSEELVFQSTFRSVEALILRTLKPSSTTSRLASGVIPSQREFCTSKRQLRLHEIPNPVVDCIFRTTSFCGRPFFEGLSFQPFRFVQYNWPWIAPTDLQADLSKQTRAELQRGDRTGMAAHGFAPNINFSL